ncbi:MAG: HDIG domain-containing protein [Ignavibacteriales bacterium]|nr:MAG: HDIG domain-containing protein [Ignavibacteriales bacterium]
MNSKMVEKIRSSLRVKLVIILITALLIVLMFPRGESIESEVTVGSVWVHEDIISSITFEILKDPKTYEREKIQVARAILPIFLRDISLEKLYLDSLKDSNLFLTKVLSKNNNAQNSTKLLSDGSYSTLYKFTHKQKPFTGSRISSITQVFSNASQILNKIYQRGLLSVSYKDIPRDSIALRDGKFENAFSKTNYLDRNSVNNFIQFYLNGNVGSDTELNVAIEEYIANFIKPNLVFSRQLTDAAVQNAKDKIPPNVGIVNENERIVAKHDRITPDVKLKIGSYKIAKGLGTGYWERFSQNFGKFLHILIILLPFIIYIVLFRKRIYGDNLKIVLIACIILFISFLTFLIYQLDVPSPVEFLVLVPVASMLLTIIFDSRVGFYGTVIISLIVGGLRGNDYAFALTNIIAGGLAAFTVRDIKNRTQIFRSFLYIFIGYALSIIAFGFERFDSFNQLLSSFAFAISNALISPVLTYGLIIFVERIFKITTDLTLLELTDFNQPLLRELAKSAPGTFNHSITIGTLVETTAEAIGANSTLARVGAYYHDIGKTVDPESFVENQINSKNIHEQLSPERSVKLILDHVKKGIELGQNYSLPKEVIDFIPMHHGTMIISYFYEKAKELYGEAKVDLNDYRYPGPKPNTKETAVVMLADACESTVRSLNDADSQKIENVINNLINSRIDDGQLDEAPLTFKDIKQIKESFLSILVGHQHKRIRYPKQEELENTKSEE